MSASDDGGSQKERDRPTDLRTGVPNCAKSSRRMRPARARDVTNILDSDDVAADGRLRA